MMVTKPKTKILLDGGDPKETLQVKQLLGFINGQTTNPRTCPRVIALVLFLGG